MIIAAALVGKLSLLFQRRRCNQWYLFGSVDLSCPANGILIRWKNSARPGRGVSGPRRRLWPAGVPVKAPFSGGLETAMRTVFFKEVCRCPRRSAKLAAELCGLEIESWCKERMMIDGMVKTFLFESRSLTKLCILHRRMGKSLK